MSRSRRKRPVTGKRITDLKPGEVQVLARRFGVSITPGYQEPERADDPDAESCTFCGRTGLNTRHLFDGIHQVTICLSCLESADED